MEPASEQKYGGCEGPDAMYVKLISYDGHEFIIRREYALTSGTIKAMLSGPGNNFDTIFINYSRIFNNCKINKFSGQFAENETNEILFREIP
jgi:transcription elongation factor B subunit 1